MTDAHIPVTLRIYERPEKGVYPAVCVGWKDDAPRDDGQPTIRLRYQLTARMSTGRRFIVSRKFTRTITGSSALRNWLSDWRGKKLAFEELADGLWLTQLVGLPCVLTVDLWDAPSGATIVTLPVIAPWDYRSGPAPTIEETTHG